MLLLLLLLSHFSRVRLCATPEMAAHQAPLSLGFSRQEYWSGLPFPSTMHESEKWVKSLSHVWLFATPWTAAYHAPLSMGFSRQEYWSRLPLTSPIKDTWSYKLSVSVSCPVVPDSATPWTAAHQAPLSMRFSRQGYWNGLSFPSPEDLANPGIEPRSPALQADSSPTELQGRWGSNPIGL